MSEYTTNYELDKYSSYDKPNLRDQYNSAMDKIDTALHETHVDVYEAKATAQRAEQAVAGEVTARTDADTALQTAIDNEVTARGNADTQIRTDFETADTQVREDFATADATLNTKIDNVKREASASTLAACNYLGTIPYLSDADIATWQHAGSICSNGTHEVMISCPIPQPENNTGIVRFVSVKDDIANTIPPKTIEVGHANSITYYAPNDEYFIVPCEVMRNGQMTPIDDIWVYNSTFTNKRVITAPGNPTAISCDPTNNKIYVEIPNISGTLTKIYELNGSTFTLVGEIDIQSVAGGLHVQDFAVYNGVWYANNTVGNFVYGDIEPFGIRGTFDISKYCTVTEYKLFGEVNGCDFTPDGHLLCLGDAGLATGGNGYGYIHTIFEIVYPNSKVAPIYVATNHFYTDHMTQTIDGNFTRLKQCGPFAAPQLASPMINVIGNFLRANFTADITTGPICVSPFSKTSFLLNGHTLTAPSIRSDNKLEVFGTGTLKVNQITANASEMLDVSFQANVTLDPDSATNYFAGTRTGTVINIGSITNPKSVKFPGTSIDLGGANGTGTFIGSPRVITLA